MKISIRWTQIEAGTSQPFYKYDFQKLAPLLTPTWILHLWEYLSTCNSTFSEHSPWTYTLPCENDFFLMDTILHADIPLEHKMIFNEIRMHLRLLSASDLLILGTGSTIHPHVPKGLRFRTSKFQWPMSHPFPRKWLKVWNSLLRSYIYPKLQHAPIGRYHTDSHQIWTTFSSADGEFVNDGTSRYQRSSRTRSAKYLPTAMNHECNHSADIFSSNNEVTLLGHAITTATTMDNQHEPTAWGYYLKAPKWQKNLWGNIDITEESIELIRDHLLNDNINAAGDRSVKRGKAAQAWCLFRKDTHEILLRGVAPVHGDYDHMTSMRPETVSSIAAGTFINLIASTIPPSTIPTITFFSDNEAAVVNSQRTHLHDIGSVLENDIDVTIQNVKLMKNQFFFL